MNKKKNTKSYKYKGGTELNKRTYILAFCIFILATGGFTAMPLFVEMTKIHGITLVQVGLLTSVYIFSQKFTPIGFGPIGDHFGHKKLACTGEFLRGAGFISLAFTNPFWLLLISAAVAGLGGGAAGPSLKTLLMLSVKPPFRPKASALRSTAVNVGMVAGPGLAGLVIFFGNVNVIFLIAGFCYWLGVTLIFIFIPAKPQQQFEPKSFSLEIYKEIGSNKRFLHLLVFMFFSWIFFAQLFVTIPNYAKNFTPHIEQMYLINGILGICLEYPIGSLMSKVKKPGCFVLMGTLLLFLSFVTFGSWHSFYGLCAGIILFTLGELFIFPFVETMVANLSSGNQNMAAYFGASSLGDGLGRPSGSLLGALLFSFVPYAFIGWYVFALVCLVLLVYGFFLQKILSPEETVKPYTKNEISG